MIDSDAQPAEGQEPPRFYMNEDCAFDEKAFEYFCFLEDEIEKAQYDGDRGHEQHCRNEIRKLREKYRVF